VLLAGTVVPGSFAAARNKDEAAATAVVMTEPVTIGIAVTDHGTSLVVGGAGFAFDIVSRPAVMAAADGEPATREFLVNRNDAAGVVASSRSGANYPCVVAFQ
jgi:hypothetical protein